MGGEDHEYCGGDDGDAGMVEIWVGRGKDGFWESKNWYGRVKFWLWRREKMVRERRRLVREREKFGLGKEIAVAAL